MKKLSVMLCLIALLAFTLNGCGGSGTTDTSYYGGGDGGGTTTTAPTVTSCTTNLTPGQTCTINGTSFGASRDSGQSTVSFVPQVTGGTTLTATTYLSWSDTAIQCVTPSVVTGIQYVVVVNRYTSSGMLYSSTTYVAGVNGTTGTAPTAAPAVTSQAPNPATAGASVTLTGTNFPISYGYILVNGAVVSSTFTTTTAVFTIPAGTATGATVTLGGGVGGSTTYSLVIGSSPTNPTITSFSPNPVNAGANVTINGTNLGTGGTVSFGGTSATPSAWTATAITVTVPAATAAGSVTVTVTPTGATAATGTLTVASATTPLLTAVTPASGAVGTAVTLTGTNLGAGGTITFGATAATATSWGATTVVTTVPTGATAGALTITVTPTGATAATIGFTVSSSPTKTWHGANALSGINGVNIATAPAINQNSNLQSCILSNGNVVVAYCDRAAAAGPNHIYARIWNGTQWSTPAEDITNATIFTAAAADSSYNPAIAADSSGGCMLVFQNDTNRCVYWAYYNGTAWQKPTVALPQAVNTTNLTAALNDDGFPAVDIDASGRAVITWTNATANTIYANLWLPGATGGLQGERLVTPDAINAITPGTAPAIGFLSGASLGYIVYAAATPQVNAQRVDLTNYPTTTWTNAGTAGGAMVLAPTNLNGVGGTAIDLQVSATQMLCAYNNAVPGLVSNLYSGGAWSAASAAMQTTAVAATTMPQLQLLSDGTAICAWSICGARSYAATWSGAAWGPEVQIDCTGGGITQGVGVGAAGTTGWAGIIQQQTNTAPLTYRLYGAIYTGGSWLRSTTATDAIDANTTQDVQCNAGADTGQIPAVVMATSGNLYVTFMQTNAGGTLQVYNNSYY